MKARKLFTSVAAGVLLLAPLADVATGKADAATIKYNKTNKTTTKDTAKTATSVMKKANTTAKVVSPVVSDTTTDETDPANPGDATGTDPETPTEPTETQKWGDVEWSVDDQGVLHLSAGTGVEGVAPWADQIITAISVEGLVVFPANSANLFAGMSSLTGISYADGASFDTTNVTNMSGMFKDDTALESLDLSGFNTANVTSMDSMFANDAALTSLKVANWDVSNVTSMNNTFGGVSSLTNFDLTGWNTGKVEDFTNIFAGMTALKSVTFSDTFTNNGLAGKTDDEIASLSPVLPNATDTMKWRATAGESVLVKTENWFDPATINTLAGHGVASDTYVLDTYSQYVEKTPTPTLPTTSAYNNVVFQTNDGSQVGESFVVRAPNAGDEIDIADKIPAGYKVAGDSTKVVITGGSQDVVVQIVLEDPMVNVPGEHETDGFQKDPLPEAPTFDMPANIDNGYSREPHPDYPKIEYTNVSNNVIFTDEDGNNVGQIVVTGPANSKVDISNQIPAGYTSETKEVQLGADGSSDDIRVNVVANPSPVFNIPVGAPGNDNFVRPEVPKTNTPYPNVPWDNVYVNVTFVYGDDNVVAGKTLLVGKNGDKVDISKLIPSGFTSDVNEVTIDKDSTDVTVTVTPVDNPKFEVPTGAPGNDNYVRPEVPATNSPYKPLPWNKIYTNVQFVNGEEVVGSSVIAGLDGDKVDITSLIPSGFNTDTKEVTIVKGTDTVVINVTPVDNPKFEIPAGAPGNDNYVRPEVPATNTPYTPMPWDKIFNNVIFKEGDETISQNVVTGKDGDKVDISNLIPDGYTADVKDITISGENVDQVIELTKNAPEFNLPNPAPNDPDFSRPEGKEYDFHITFVYGDQEIVGETDIKGKDGEVINILGMIPDGYVTDTKEVTLDKDQPNIIVLVTPQDKPSFDLPGNIDNGFERPTLPGPDFELPEEKPNDPDFYRPTIDDPEKPGDGDGNSSSSSSDDNSSSSSDENSNSESDSSSSSKGTGTHTGGTTGGVSVVSNGKGNKVLAHTGMKEMISLGAIGLGIIAIVAVMTFVGFMKKTDKE